MLDSVEVRDRQRREINRKMMESHIVRDRSKYREREREFIFTFIFENGRS